jgi:hypothetical protein
MPEIIGIFPTSSDDALFADWFTDDKVIETGCAVDEETDTFINTFFDGRDEKDIHALLEVAAMADGKVVRVKLTKEDVDWLSAAFLRLKTLFAESAQS